MDAVLLLGGVLLLLVLCADVFATTTGSGSTRSAGPVTARVAKWLWRGALVLHRRRPSHRGLHYFGFGLTVGTVATWIVAMWAAWTLVFASAHDSVVGATTGEPTDLAAKAYFAGYAVLTLGNGEYVPSSTAWQIATLGAAATGLALVTLAVTYILNVVQASSRRRALATTIWTLGDDADAMVHRAGADPRHVNDQLWSLVELFADVREQHVSFPVLHYLHSTDRHRALPAQAAELAVALERLRASGSTATTPLSPSIVESLARVVDEYIQAVAPYEPEGDDDRSTQRLEAGAGWTV